jgi:gliding motility-associated-like protein
MLGPDTVKCKDSLLTIGINTGATSYLWNTGDTTATIQVSQAGTYILTADFAPCGLMSDTIIVYEKECFPNSIPSDPTIVKCEILIPNAFSPNGDGLNDVLKPILKFGIVGFEFVQFELFNRWGKKIFSSKNPNDAWDGKFNGEEQPTDSYYFYIRYRCNGDMKIVKGDVVLIR